MLGERRSGWESRQRIFGLVAAIWCVLVSHAAMSGAQLRAAPSRAALELEEECGDGPLARVLREAPITAWREIGVGVTKPLRLELDWEGRTRVAAFKYEHTEIKGLTRFDNAPPELNFTDSYSFDRAAYLLDRELALGMVPLTVLRRFQGDDGAVVEWIEGSITETERREENLGPDDPSFLRYQKALGRVFDALIMNIDRNEGNLLYTPSDWRLHLIDHTRAFRLSRKPPESFMKVPAKITPGLLAGLESLEEERLVELLKGIIARGKIQALLSRRDAIVEKLGRDRQRLGDAYVLIPESALE